jgi:hypothetical protein
MKYTKGTPKYEKERKKNIHPQNPKTKRNPNTPIGTSPQNPETITPQQGHSCLCLGRTKTPSIIINRELLSFSHLYSL